MTPDEFVELRQWMTDRWPSLQHLSDSQWLAYREELGGFEIRNVWQAVQSCLDSGDGWAPPVGKLRRLAADEQKHAEERRMLPMPGGMSWAEYSKQRWGEVVPLWQAAWEMIEGTRQ